MVLYSISSTRIMAARCESIIPFCEHARQVYMHHIDDVLNEGGKYMAIGFNGQGSIICHGQTSEEALLLIRKERIFQVYLCSVPVPKN